MKLGLMAKTPTGVVAPPTSRPTITPSKKHTTAYIIGGSILALLGVYLVERKKASSSGPQTPTSQEPLIIATPSNADTLSGEFLSGATNIIGQGAALTAQPAASGMNTFPPVTGGIPAGFNPGGTEQLTVNSFPGGGGTASVGGGTPLHAIPPGLVGSQSANIVGVI